MFRTRQVTLILGLLALMCVPIHAQSEATDAAKQAMEPWLKLVDEGNYGESWDEASAYFKTQMPKQQWEGTLKKVRTPLGKMQSRELKSAKYTADLPNAPKGEYVLIQYQTSFENAPSTVETVVPMKQEDGSWRVSGYFIRPTK